MTINVSGKFNDAIVFSDVLLEENLSEQIKDILDLRVYSENKIRIMPDTHFGAGCPIGLTMNITNIITPNFVGVDIGCGMLVVEFDGDMDFEKLDGKIRRFVPSGFNTRHEVHAYVHQLEDKIKSLYAYKVIKFDRAMKSLGSLGGGNHFIEVNKDNDGKTYLVVHSGSRNLGFKVANFHQKVAIDNLKKKPLLDRKNEVELLKSQGRHNEIQSFIANWELNSNVPNALAWLEDEDFDAYIHDMKICQEYASLNRKAMADVIGNEMGWIKVDEFETIHNYIDTDEMILRKGAVSAKAGERLIIPINMRDGCILATGKGNDEWNESAPHGSGRLMGRNEAKKKLNLSDFKNEMTDVFTTSVGQNTLDEAPMAYKGIDYIIRNIKDTVEIESIIKPIYNYKHS